MLLGSRKPLEVRSEHELEILPLERGLRAGELRIQGFGVEPGQQARQIRAQGPERFECDLGRGVAQGADAKMEIVERRSEKSFGDAPSPPPWANAKRRNPAQVSLARAGS